MKNPAPAKPPADDSSLLEEAFKDVAPLPDHGRALHAPRRARPLPYQTWRDEREALAESLTEAPAWDVEFGDETYFLRLGLPRHIIRNLRRGHWVMEAELDLHGMNRMEARLSLGDFLNQCLAEGLRCVRVIHGKGLGSRNREPVLKAKVRHWLTQREEVLAFSQARPVDGGSGALVVLLKAASRSPR